MEAMKKYKKNRKRRDRSERKKKKEEKLPLLNEKRINFSRRMFVLDKEVKR